MDEDQNRAQAVTESRLEMLAIATLVISLVLVGVGLFADTDLAIGWMIGGFVLLGTAVLMFGLRSVVSALRQGPSVTVTD